MYTKFQQQRLGQSPSENELNINTGSLGAAYFAASMAEIDESRDWQQLLSLQLNSIFKALGLNSYPHAGMLGGLTGLAFLLQTSRQRPEEYASALRKLEGRILYHLDKGLENLKTSIGMPRFEYDYSCGITGMLYHFQQFRPDAAEQQLVVDRALQYLIDTAQSGFNNFFWTPSVAVPEEVIEQEPKAAFGILDFGQAHGICGVLGLLLAHQRQTQLEDIETAIEAIIDAAAYGYETSIVPGIPYYLCGHPEVNAWFGDGSSDYSAGPLARNGWCYGLPILEAYSAKYGIELPNGMSMSFDSPEFQDPNLGVFNEAGLCHGIAGRMALNYLIHKPIPDTWWTLAEQLLDDFNQAHDEGTTGKLTIDHGFWDGVGGLIVVVEAIRQAKPLPKQLQILGLPYGNITM
ncbi:MAG: lanthionine synthetase LanC family protein [Corynebacterium sp.]|nr:lanthionine synthetase LanC family protein [Corynebacterium sp.]